MLEVAKSRTTYKEVEYRCVVIEDMEFPGMKDEMRRPMMLLISAVKNRI